MSGLRINIDESHGEVVRIELDGHLDAHTFEKLEDQLEKLFRKNKYRLMVDLQKLRYISSAGAGVFIGSLGTCQDHDGNIALVRPSPEVKEIFELLGVFHVFPIAGTPEEALTVLSA
jgi:anti-sigma B factor antagonist